MPPGSEQPELSPAGISGLELRILNFPLRVATLLRLVDTSNFDFCRGLEDLFEVA